MQELINSLGALNPIVAVALICAGLFVVLIAIRIVINLVRMIPTLAVPVAMVVGAYLSASVFLPSVPKQDSTVTIVGLALVIAVLGFIWIPTLPMQLMRFLVILVSVPALVSQLIPTVAPGLANGNLNVRGSAFLGVSPQVVIVSVILVLGIFFFNRRINVNKNIDKRFVDERIDRRNRDESYHINENRNVSYHNSGNE